MKDFAEKVEVILEALPYIRKFQGATIVVKYGGSAMIDDKLKKEVVRDIALLNYVGMKPVIIHGGGKEINRWLQKIGKEPLFSPAGLRVTDEETMEVAEMVLGRISKNIVQLLNSDGETKAVSLSGKDGGILNATKMKHEFDHGHVGDISSVNGRLIKTLLDAGNIPVISSVGLGEDGLTYNINADYAACAIAKELQADKLILMTDVDGVLAKDGSLINRISVASAQELFSDGTISGGMIPKLRSSLDVVSGGVGSVHIINGTVEHSLLLEILTSHGVGTMVTA